MKGVNKITINQETLKQGLKYWLASQVLYVVREQFDLTDIKMNEDKSAELTIEFKEKEESK